MRERTRGLFETMCKSMEARGWFLESRWSLPASFVGNTVVTPYFFCSDIPKRPFGDYLVEGLVGLMHRDFEQLWAHDCSKESRRNGYGVGLHLANFRELATAIYISPDVSSDRDIESFCCAVTGILQKMPSTEKELLSAFEARKLCGIDIEAFAGYSHRNKFYAFEEFVRHSLPIGHDKS